MTNVPFHHRQKFSEINSKRMKLECRHARARRLLVKKSRDTITGSADGKIPFSTVSVIQKECYSSCGEALLLVRNNLQ